MPLKYACPLFLLYGKFDSSTLSSFVVCSNRAKCIVTSEVNLLRYVQPNVILLFDEGSGVRNMLVRGFRTLTSSATPWFRDRVPPYGLKLFGSIKGHHSLLEPDLISASDFPTCFDGLGIVHVSSRRHRRQVVDCSGRLGLQANTWMVQK